MKAIIMAGGEGLRLKSVTGDLPKPMALLAGKPVLEHILLLLKRNGITDVCITLRYRPELIRDYFRDGKQWGMHIRYHMEGEALGTAGGVRACSDFYGERDFLVISGDCACDFDLAPMREAHRRHRPAVTMALYSSDTPLSYGIVLTDARNRVVSFIEKPEWSRVVSDLVNTGIYIVSPEAMDFVPEGMAFDFSRDLFPRLMERGMELRGIPLPGYWCDIGTPRDYHRCNLDALDGRLRLEPPAAFLARSAPSADRPLSGAARELGCRNRAKLMRIISQTLMEAGAEFSDGLSLRNQAGTVHIAPSAERDALLIHAKAENIEKSEELADNFLAWIGEMSQN